MVGDDAASRTGFARWYSSPILVVTSAKTSTERVSIACGYHKERKVEYGEHNVPLTFGCVILSEATDLSEKETCPEPGEGFFGL
jgi:hypothetical protein